MNDDKVKDQNSMPHHLPKLVYFLILSIGLCRCSENSLAQLGDDNTQTKLIWKSGDSLPGKMVKADSESIRWHATSIFRDQVDIDSRFLQQIEFSALDTTSSEDPSKESAKDVAKESAKDVAEKQTGYVVQTIDGMRLLGEILSLDEKQLTITSDRFGKLEMARNRIASLQNMRNLGAWGGGQIDLTQWNANRGFKKYWTVNSQNQLESSRNNIHLFRQQELPRSALIEVEFRWEKKLDFVFGLAIPQSGRQSDSIPRLETWDDSLVFSHGDNFEVILESFKREEQRIKLLLHWDQEKNLIAIHDEQGALLCQAEIKDKPQSNRGGIFLENKSGDLTVSSLLVRESLPGFDSTRPSFQVVGEAAQNGNVVGFDGKQWIMEVHSGSDSNSKPAKLEIPVDRLSNVFSINPSQLAETEGIQILYGDGMSISGKLESYDGQQMQLKTNFSGAMIGLSIDGATKLIFNSQSPPPNDESQFLHVLTSPAGTIRGRLEPGTQTDSDILCWHLPGARQAVPFGKADAKVVLAKKAPDKNPEEAWPDTLYFFNRDVVPCKLLEIDEQSIRFESFTENRQIQASLIKAIDLRSSSVPEKLEFSDPGWQFSGDDKPKIVDDRLHLPSGSKASHSRLMVTGRFDFEMQWERGQYGVLETKLFSDSNENSATGHSANLMVYDNQIFIQSNDGNQVLAAPNQRAKISYRFEGDQLTLYIAGKKVHTHLVSARSIRGAGVSFQVSNPQNIKELTVKLSNMRRVASERNEPIIVDPQQKELLLTIPRIKKNSPPQHILRATNSDMLRGEIVSMDANRIEFRAGQDNILFPRSLVASLIWLHFKDKRSKTETSANDLESEISDAEARSNAEETKPAKENRISSPADAERQSVQLLMLGDRRLTLELQAWSENRLIGHSAALGKCEVPFDQILELRFGTFANQAFDVPYSDWIAKLALDPKLETGTDADSRSEMLFGSSSPLIGVSVKDVSFRLKDGQRFQLEQSLGKVVVLDFWATWCGPCVKGLPDLIAVTGEFSAEEVVFIGINPDEDAATIEAFQKARSLDFQVGLGDGTLVNRFEANSLPKTIVIDPSGKIAFVKTGYSADQKEKLKAAINKLLEVK